MSAKPDTSAAEQQPQPDPAPAPSIDAADEQEPGRNRDYYPREDLDAQRRMAVATEELVGLSGTQIKLVSIEIGLVLIAICAAFWAAWEARKAAKATAATVDITRDTARRQLRAYIVADTDAEWEQAYRGSADNVVGYNFGMKWKNCGATPARRCQGWTNLAVFDEMIPSDFDYPDKLGPKITETNHIGPGQDFRSKVGGLSIPDAQAAERGEKYAYVWSWLEYDDIFGRVRRRTEVCYELRISKNGQVCTPTIVGPFNGADEDCYHKPKT